MEPTSFDVVTLWYRYEEIAMHFNNLLMQFRLQLIGGVGAIGTIATYLIGGKVDDVVQRAWLRTVLAGGLLVLILAAAIIDVWYYSRLLEGTVATLIDLEAKHPEIQLSTKIEETVGHGKHAIRYSYGLMLLTLFLFALWSARDYRMLKGRQPPAATLSSGL